MGARMVQIGMNSGFILFYCMKEFLRGEGGDLVLVRWRWEEEKKLILKH